MTLSEFIEDVDAPQASLVVVNRDQPMPVQRMLEGLFEGQPVAVSEADLPEGERDVVLLVRDGDVVASSPLSAVMDAVLLVNSDLFITGTRGLEEAELPDVLAGLEETRFDVRGYPETEKDKLLLIAVSRAIEREAWLAGEGRLRSAFQRLSRMNDESGTRAVYETLAESDVDVHVYGTPDWMPPVGFDVTAHAGYGDDFRKGWFVVFRRPEGGGTALVAYADTPRQWSGFWTGRDDLVDAVAEDIAYRL
ncbi:histidine kinase [Halarchaeum sp. CBA1220]|uniref:histidine kinase n=1 Tax=Halarchaeum sp. CBA1220 TaxID=1853682 RepID=UPI000F3A81AA|nr:histidine kinase [Halarchaeum sp. CBA1220]QLC33080.1 histidine kinase [Halarchaeum sp. CBA1220]